ncbi:methyltransferase domain-containing protein [uncultured Lacinutrix sp.]|uniref:methyltransferase domain-containing protein n=1 Tax=uncultured Lacinutrix sp. TaxID=574032 RepID=UPI00262E5057|nr:methyltransferase domain-containing protein [uncultured Lacinutrix sp.]
MEIKRKKFQGVLNILSFNRHFYVIGLSTLAIIIFSLLYIECSNIILYSVIGSFVYGLLMPLIISAYVYDYSGYYNLNWLKACDIDTQAKNIININAGFDETSFLIKNKFPKAELQVFDFYSKKKHTEPAIVRARKVSLTYPYTRQISTKHIPLEDDTTDIVFLLSTAHEIRNNTEKILFLKECHRICKPTGKVIMVEHLRDLPNFFAFSIGFTHFFSKKTWKTVYKKAGFSSFKNIKFTPFMSIIINKP